MGFLVIDKPGGLTSHAVVGRLRRLLGIRRIGHTGTLDPMATGVLPIAVGQATRLIPFLHEERKCYRATVRFGVTTDTQDAEGEVVSSRDPGPLDVSRLHEVLAEFAGEILQVPPMHSALKRNGVPLYRLARRGESVERPARPVTISRLDVDTLDWPEMVFTVECTRGTYVRTLAHDMGELLGCGAHLKTLRRLSSGPFELAQAHTLETVAALLEADEELPWVELHAALAGYTPRQVLAEAAARLAHGIPPDLALTLGPALAPGENVLLEDETGRLLAVATFAPGTERPGDFLLKRVLASEKT